MAPDAAEGLCPRCLLALNLGPQTQLSGDEATARPTAAPPSIAELAPLFPQLDILELLGCGGMGAVYRARQKQLDRIVALKILPPGVGSDATFAARFASEARALARLNHPNIVTLYEFGVTGKGDTPVAATVDGGQSVAAPAVFYFIMEFVDGMNLRQLLAASRLSAREALAIVPQICDALQYAHDAGIVHRDIKPENILLDRRGRVKVADFGLAKLVGPVAGVGDPGQPASPLPATGDHTVAGVVLGTPQYMAPEQREHPTDVDHRADIYSLGVVFYQMLTGELPQGDFAAPSKKVVVDVRLDEVVLRALEKQPELRYQQVSDVKTILETIATTPVPAPADAAGAGRSAKGRMVYVIFPLLYLALVVGTVLTAAWLPERVATHFGLAGRANGWMSRTGYLAFVTVFPLLIALFFAGISALIKILPACFVNIPNRDFWLAPVRRAATAVLVRHWLAGLLCLLTLFFAGLHALTIRANRSAPPQLPMDGLLLLVMVFLLALMIWLTMFLTRFAEIRTAGDAAPSSRASGRGTLCNAPSPSSENSAPGPSRFSRTAIVGACWAPAGFIAFIMMFSAHKITGTYQGPAWWQDLLRFTLLPMGVTAPFGTTLLGWIAVAQIRRSAGKLYGLWLAVFDGLLFPLLAVVGLLAWFWWWVFEIALYPQAMVDWVMRHPYQPYPGPSVSDLQWFVCKHHTPLTVFCSLITAGILCSLIIRAVWRAVQPPLNDVPPIGRDASPADFRMSPSHAPATNPRWPLVLTVGLHLILLMLLVACLVVVAPKFAETFKALELGLPLVTRLLITVSRFVQYGGFLLVPVLVVLDVGIAWLLQRLGGRKPLVAWAIAGSLGLVALSVLAVSSLFLPLSQTIEKISVVTLPRAEKPMSSQGVAEGIAFGPPTSRMIDASDANRDGVVAFRFKGGEVAKPPVTITAHFQKHETRGFTPELRQWMHDQNVDLLLHLDGKFYDVLFLDMRDGFLGQPTEWNNMDPARVFPALAQLETQNTNPGPGIFGGCGYRDGLGSVQAFRTRDGLVGCYQLRGHEDVDGHGVEIRYKLVQGGGTQTAAVTRPAPAAAAPTFGPVIEREIPFDHGFIDFQSGTVLKHRVPEERADEMAAWIRKTGIDAAVEESGPPSDSENARFPRLAGMGGLGFAAPTCVFVRENTDTFETARPADAETRLKIVEENRGVPWSSASGLKPWWFRTLDGAKGMVQITGTTTRDKPLGLVIRYKLVEGGVTTVPGGR